jgi:ribosomal protein S18 acetylase RimI-like enzyme
VSNPVIRPAQQEDLPAVAAIYDALHALEEHGKGVTGWQRGVYPTYQTAEAALQKGTLYVEEAEGGRILAAAKIDQEQVPEYAHAPWAYAAADREVLVLHTLVVDPAAAGRGCGSRFVAYYEDLARAKGCTCLRMDTNEKNRPARRLYQKLGYREAGIVSCSFNGIPGVRLVCLEKKL